MRRRLFQPMQHETRGPRHAPARWLPWALGLLAVAYVAVLWTNPLAAPTYTVDSDSYIEFYTTRTAGYPLFLDLAAAVFGSVEAAPGVQLVLAAAAFAFLAWSVHRAFGSPLLALLVALSLFGNPELARYHASVMTEALFVSLLSVMVGAMAMLIARPTATLAALSALACGVAVSVRPAGLSLLPIWPILLWFLWERCAGQRRRLAVAVLAPLALCGLAESVAWQAAHPGRTSRPSLANLHLFAKALMMERVPVAADDDLGRFLSAARTQVAPARAFVAGAPDWQTWLLLLSRYEIAGQYQLFRDEVEALAEQRDVSENHLMGEVGWRAVAAAPAAWAQNALSHYVGLWTVYELITPATSERYAAYVQPARVPFFETGVIRPYRPAHAAAWPSRVVMAGGFVVTGLSVGIAVVRRWRGGGAGLDGRLVLAAVCGLLVHGHYLLVALFGTAFARYSLTLWPLLALCGLLLADYGARSWASRARRTGFRSAGMRDDERRNRFP